MYTVYILNMSSYDWQLLQTVQEHRRGKYWLDQLRRASRDTRKRQGTGATSTICFFFDLWLDAARPAKDSVFTRIQPFVHIWCLQPTKCSLMAFLHVWISRVIKFFVMLSWGFDWWPRTLSDGLSFDCMSRQSTIRRHDSRPFAPRLVQFLQVEREMWRD